MSNGIQRFEDFWRRMDLTPRARYIHPDDAPFLCAEEHPSLQFQLLPIPLIGNLRTAEAVILMLNSGFGKDDLVWEQAHPTEHASMLAVQRANLHQRYFDGAYPFYDFDPRFRNHPGAGYWKGGAQLAVRKRQQAKLSQVAEALACEWSVPVEQAHKHLAHRVAVLEWFPYRSTSFEWRSAFQRVPSCQEALRLVRSLVNDNQKLIVVPRSVDKWGFRGFADGTDNLVVYDGPQGTAASLTLNSAGGKAILQRLLHAGPEI